MHALKGVFLEAWSRIKPILDADPHELHARLARRSNALLSRPFREWCIGLRSNDCRLNTAVLSEQGKSKGATVLSERSESKGSHAIDQLFPHSVTLTRSVLQRLCRPVAIEPFTDLPDAAAQLGVSTKAIRKAIARGQFRLHHHRRWRRTPAHGRCFRKYPEVAADDLFNPTADWKLQSPDPVWGDRWTLFPDDLPQGFQQTLQRIPLWLPAKRPGNGIYRPAQRTKDQGQMTVLSLSDAATDNEHLTTDNGQPATPSGLSRCPELVEGTQHSGLERFWGWYWLCPACNQTCRLILLPMPFQLPPVFRDYLKPHLKARHEAPDDIPTTFACARCHNPRHALSWARGHAAWNELVTTLSGGLLFGHEVQIPPALNTNRKTTKRPTPKNTPAPKREEVAQLLLQGLSYKEIAQEMGITYITACWHAQQLMRIHKVKRKPALLEKLRATTLQLRQRSA
jgi:DNA-binding CsgD family transcriptional regulator